MPRALPCCLLLLAAAWGTAHAEVRRCRTPEGAVVYTDRDCAAVGGVEQAAPAQSPRPAVARWTCARTVRDLAFEVTNAIDNRDPNRLAGLYHWPGHSTRDGYSVLGRLETIAERPLIGVSAVMPEAEADAFGLVAEAPRRAPVGLRLQQMRADGTSTASTVLGLTRHLGCWWLRF